MYSSYCNVIKAIRSHTVHISCGMNHMACVMNLPVWTIQFLMFFMRLSHSQRAAGQGQQGTGSCRASSPLMHGWLSRRSRAAALRDEMGQDAPVICTIKSGCFSCKLRSTGRHPKAEPGFYNSKQPLELTLLDLQRGQFVSHGLAELFLRENGNVILKFAKLNE